MTVVGLHPEELFDKLQAGELLPAEAERLRSHLERCEVCRFEYAARLDFQAEALELGAMPPPALPLRPLASTPLERGAPTPRPTSAPRRRARRTLLIVGFAAAALISASAALAASVTGRPPWRALGALFAPPAPTVVSHPSVPATKPKLAASPSLSPLAAAVPEVAPPSEPGKAPPSAESPRRLEVTRRAQVGATRAVAAERGNAEPPPDEAAAKEPPVATKLFSDANQARRAGDIGRATSLYHLLQEQYPASPEASLSRVTLALLQLDGGDAQAALAGFERYLSGSSRGLEAEALVGRARALGRLGRRDAELAAWREVQRRYPSSVYGRQATERLSALGQP